MRRQLWPVKGPDGPGTGRAGRGRPGGGVRRRAGWVAVSAASLVLTAGQGLALSAPAPALAATPAATPGASAAVAALPPWDCPDTFAGYTFDSVPILNRALIQIQRVDPATGDVSGAGVTSVPLDAVGHNPLDDYFYGVAAGSGTVYRIGRDGALAALGVTLPLSPVAGDIDTAGHWWVVDATGRVAEVDLAPGSGTYGQVLRQGVFDTSALQVPGDWSYIENGPAGTGLYGLSRTTAAGQPAHLVFVDTGNLTDHDLGPVTGGYPATAFTATFTDGTYLYASSGTEVFRVDLNARDARPVAAVSPAPADGAQCARLGVPTRLAVTKTVDRRNDPGDQFKIGVFDEDGNLLTSATTQDGEDSVTTPPVDVVPGRTYHLFDHLTNDYLPPRPEFYHSDAFCTDAEGHPLPLQGGPGDWTFQAVRTGEIRCEIKNAGVGHTDLQLVKEVVNGPGGTVGDTVHYRFHVINTGTTTLQHVTVDDPRLGAHFDCGGPVPAGAALFCGDFLYVISPSDAADGIIVNTAHAHGEDAFGTPADAEDTAAVPVYRPTPGLSITKSAEPTDIDAAGDRVTYHFQVRNTGQAVLHDVKVTDRYFTGTGGFPAVQCPTDTLLPGDVTDCTAVYTATQEDIDSGQITNSAGATAVSELGDHVEAGPADAEVATHPRPGVTLTKTAEPGTVDHAGQPVRYTYTVENTGNTTLHSVEVTDPGFDGHGSLEPLDCGDRDHTLLPGGRVTCTVVYEVTQQDIDAGALHNTGQVSAYTPDGTELTDTDAQTVEAARTGGLSLVKSAEPDAPADFTAGQVVTYFYEVLNTGNTTVDDIAIDETRFTGNGTKGDVTCPEASLPPGGREVCRATYTLTAEDIAQGSVANTAHATGTGPGGALASGDSSVVLEGPPANPGLELDKSVAPASVGAAGQQVTYSFHVTNTGNTALHGLHITEDFFGGTGGPLDISCPVDTLASGSGTTCTATYTVTQADIDAGSVANTATAGALDPGGADVDSGQSSAELTTAGTGALHLDKTAAPTRVWAAGDQVGYEFTLTNTGTATLVAPDVVETSFSGSGTPLAASCPEEPIAPGDSVLCTAAYTVTDADVTAGRITNTARATAARADDGTAVTSNEDSAAVTVNRSGLSIDKSVRPSEAAAGDTVTYSFKVTNTGNTPVHDLAIAEDAFGGSTGLPPATCPVDELAAGATTTCTATYTVTDADAAAGHVDNTAHATAVNGAGAQVASGTDSARLTTTSEPQTGSLKLVKKAEVEHKGNSGYGDGGSGGKDDTARPGDVVHWTLTVTNTGGTTLHDVTVDDPTAGEISCPKSTLAPGESMTCTAPPYTVTEQDAENGCVSDTATATGLTPDGTKVTSPKASASVTVTSSGGKDW
ncbi:hypothetical protein [Streptomyces sp. NPDC021020]|uniref:DUF7507 domain-containing protein n=1 Tax=Streptomyces sp. NPDC021020 TaxID=3365109 RepID=UPI0037B8A686